MERKTEIDLKRLDAMTDEEALRRAQEDPNAQPTDAAFWADTELAEPRTKKIPENVRRHQN